MKAVKRDENFLPQFSAKIFVAEGYETSDGCWCERDCQLIKQLRNDYPELSHWGDLALGCAFDDFSRDVLNCGWAEWVAGQRTETFLNYCYWRQEKGQGIDGIDEQLEGFDGWKRWRFARQIEVGARAA